MRYNRRTAKLLREASLLLVVPAVLLLAPAAYAQDESGETPGDESSLDDTEDEALILVTGTRIRGVAPVGSDLLQLDQEAMAKTGQLSTADILAEVPAVLTLGAGNSYVGGASQGTADLNALSFNKSPNIHGFGPQATLSLVNGHRVPYDGANMNTFDGDNIPVQMLQRIEIVPDGTSATYGADAISGTVNYIMRAPFTGLEFYAQYGLADGQDSYQLTGVGGYEWGSGGIVVSYQHADSDALHAGSRTSLYDDDFTAIGGPGSSNQANPGNIIVNGVSYAIPFGQDGKALTLSQFGAAGSANTQNVWTGYDAIPQFERDQVAVNLRQDITDWLEFHADGFWSKRDFDIALYNAAANNRNLLTIPNSNFYSPCNHSLAGAPAALVVACGMGSLTVAYNTINDIGPGRRTGYTETYDSAAGFNIDLFGDWKADVYASYGQNRGKNTNTLYFGNSLGSLPALADPTPAAFNPFCDGTAFDCGNSGYADAIFGFNTLHITTTYENQIYAANFDGSLFVLPGGNVRLAVGAEHLRAKFINANDFATTVNRRHVTSGFAELYVPIFGADNAIPGFRSLELTGAVRVDDYNDVGSTTNPKFGINWSPTDWLKLRGSYGTSFRAPGLVDNDPNSQRGYLVPTFPGTVIDPSLCPTCASSPTDIAIYQALGGAAGNLIPESSESWSLGFEVAPPDSGVNIGVTYWNVNYTNQVATPVYNVGAYQAINLGYFDSQIIFNPMYFPANAASNPEAFFGPYPYDASNANCSAVTGMTITTQALYDQLITCLNAGGNGPILGAPSTNVAAITNSHRLNSGSTHGDGFDISASYDWSAGAGSWHLGAIASYILNWKVSPIQGAPVIDQVNNFGYPLRLRARAEAAWSGGVGPGELTLAGYLNYSNDYEIDQALLPVGVSSQYTSIDSFTTVDLAVHYDFGNDASSILDGIGLTVSAQNVFDAHPPFVVNTSSTASIQFDPSNASPLGRFVQFAVSKKF